MNIGPVTYLVVEFIGNQFKGEIVPEMQELVDKGLIRLMDFVVVRKNHDGSVDWSKSANTTRTLGKYSPA